MYVICYTFVFVIEIYVSKTTHTHIHTYILKYGHVIGVWCVYIKNKCCLKKHVAHTTGSSVFVNWKSQNYSHTEHVRMLSNSTYT